MKKKLIICIFIVLIIDLIIVFCYLKNNNTKTYKGVGGIRFIDDLDFISKYPPKFPIRYIEKQLNLSDDFNYNSYLNYKDDFITYYKYKEDTLVEFSFDLKCSLKKVDIFSSNISLLTYILDKDFFVLTNNEKDTIIDKVAKKNSNVFYLSNLRIIVTDSSISIGYYET